MQAEYELVAGFLLGMALGVLSVKHNLCFARALRTTTKGDDSRLQPFLITVVLLMAILPLLSRWGLLQSPEFDVGWNGALVGGLLFGVGMALADRCALGIWWRAARGDGLELCAVLGFILGASLSRPKGLEAALPPSQLSLTITLFGSLAGILLLTLYSSSHSRKSKPIQIKAAVGLTMICLVSILAAQVLSLPIGLDLGAGADSMGNFVTGRPVRNFWMVGVLAGLTLGAFLYGLRSRNLGFSRPSIKQAILSLLGGAGMGFGAQLGTGCNLASILLGVPSLSELALIGAAAMIGSFYVASGVLHHSRISR